MWQRKRAGSLRNAAASLVAKLYTCRQGQAPTENRRGQKSCPGTVAWAPALIACMHAVSGGGRPTRQEDVHCSCECVCDRCGERHTETAHTLLGTALVIFIYHLPRLGTASKSRTAHLPSCAPLPPSCHCVGCRYRPPPRAPFLTVCGPACLVTAQTVRQSAPRCQRRRVRWLRRRGAAHCLASCYCRRLRPDGHGHVICIACCDKPTIA